jgi:hypothetical protein
MSKYSENLAKLKKDIKVKVSKQKTMKTHQKRMIKFINGVTKSIEFKVLTKTIILEKGDEKKRFCSYYK